MHVSWTGDGKRIDRPDSTLSNQSSRPNLVKHRPVSLRDTGCTRLFLSGPSWFGVFKAAGFAKFSREEAKRINPSLSMDEFPYG